MQCHCRALPWTWEVAFKAASSEHGRVKADSHIAYRAHAVPLPFRAAKGLECVFPTWFTQCGRVWFTLAMPCPCHALIMPFFSRPQHSTAVERRPVGYLPAFGFFWLPRGVPRRLLAEAYQSQQSIPTSVKSGIRSLSEQGRDAAWHVWINARHGRGTAWAQHAMCESALSVN
jgi:hypothetical protein